MNKWKEKYIHLIESIDSIWSVNSYRDISKIIKDIINWEEIEAEEIHYEQIIFDFTENYSWGSFWDEDFFNWWTYYGPYFILQSPDDDNKMNVYPHINKVSSDMLEYALNRSEESNNFLLIARYIDICIDFSKKITWNSINIKYIEKYFEAVIKIYEDKLCSSFCFLPIIERAISVARSYGNKKYFEIFKDVLVDFELKQQKNIWIIGKALELFVLSKQWILVDETSKETIIKNLMNIIELDEKKDIPNIYLIEKNLLLLKYFRSKNHPDFEKLYNISESIYKKNINSSEWMIKIWYLQWLLSLQQTYNASLEDINSTMLEIQNIDLRKWLKEIKITSQITDKEMNDILNSVFWEDNEYDLKKILETISYNFIEFKENIEKRLSKESPLTDIFTNYVIDYDWWLLGVIDWWDNTEKRVIQKMWQSIQFSNIYLWIIFEGFIEKINKEDLVNFLMNDSYILEWENKKEIEELVDAFYNKNYSQLSGIIIPLIESLFRKALKFSWWNIQKIDKSNGGYMFKALGEVLNDPIMIDTCWESSIFYFRVVLSERLWLNLRNDFCHWVNREKFSNQYVAIRLFHVFLTMVIWFNFISE